jgi:ABC-type antimicrobial peptide transport system permease subunit
MALGADAGTVSRLFLSEGTWLVIAGLVVGMTGAVITSRVLESFLFNVRPIDGPAYLLAIAPLIFTALIANVFPALRAARVNPVIAIQRQ